MSKIIMGLFITYLIYVSYIGLNSASASVVIILTILLGSISYLDFKRESLISLQQVKALEESIDDIKRDIVFREMELKSGLENLGKASEDRIVTLENKVAGISLGTNLLNSTATQKAKYGWGMGGSNDAKN